MIPYFSVWYFLLKMATRESKYANLGQPGAQGENGPDGESGGCSHCPPPRTAPGY